MKEQRLWKLISFCEQQLPECEESLLKVFEHPLYLSSDPLARAPDVIYKAINKDCWKFVDSYFSTASPVINTWTPKVEKLIELYQRYPSCTFDIHMSTKTEFLEYYLYHNPQDQKFIGIYRLRIRSVIDTLLLVVENQLIQRKNLELLKNYKFSSWFILTLTEISSSDYSKLFLDVCIAEN